MKSTLLSDSQSSELYSINSSIDINETSGYKLNATKKLGVNQVPPKLPSTQVAFRLSVFLYISLKIHQSHIYTQTKPDCPVCSYRYKPYYKNGIQVRPYSFVCPICGFDFDIYRRCGFQIADYFITTEQKPPQFLQSHIKEYQDEKLYEKIYKKFCVVHFYVVVM